MSIYSIQTAFLISSAIATVGIIWDSLEMFAAWKKNETFHDPGIIMSHYRALTKNTLVLHIYDTIKSNTGFLSVVILRLACSLLFVISYLVFHTFLWPLALLTLLGHILINFRVAFGRNGADQMQTILWAGIFVFSINFTTFTNLTAAGFIFLQLVIAYETAGIAKIISPTWRNGEALHKILQSVNNSMLVSKGITVNKNLCFFGSWVTILVEIVGPLTFFGGSSAFAVFLILALVLHASIAFTMKLISFVWSFMATYPIALFLAMDFNR